MNVIGCFLVVGRKAPEVHLLQPPELEFLNKRMARAQKCGVASVRMNAIEHIFGDGVQQIFPCWHRPAMVAVALEYDGEHKDEVRRIAACIAEGKPYSLDGGDDWKNGGNAPAKLDPPKPVKPRPGGAAFSDDDRVPVMAGNVPAEELKLKSRKRK